MNYTLNTTASAPRISFLSVMRKFWTLVRHEKRSMLVALLTVIITSALTLAGPYVIGYAINHYVITGQYRNILYCAAALLGIYLIALVANYIQVITMGSVGQRVLLKIRNDVFQKLQDLPVAFFNSNKAGDLISRINNDTDKLNQFFSQGIMQFVGSVFTIIGAGVFLLIIHIKLGSAVLLPAVGLLILARVLSGWIKARNLRALQSTGNMSAEIQESLANFKVVVAFDRRDYFKERFADANTANYRAAISGGIANTILSPIFDTASKIAQIIFIIYGVYLISTGNLTVGFFISFVAYISRFYDPLRQMASLWSTFQTAFAGWDRIQEILSLDSDLPVIAPTPATDSSLLEFHNVGFSYNTDTTVLDSVNFILHPGKTYALVGPTGGGKTTTASLMARLYDPTTGTILLHGRDLRSLTADERAQKIGFILQDPFLFMGTVHDNIVYGNDTYANITDEELIRVLTEHGLETLLERFPGGISTPVISGGEGMSLGQRQLIAFMRVLLRSPELLILDEATANIDTVTEQLLEDILRKLPRTTTRVIIAHRLNTIAEADEIFFVNGGHVTPAGSLEHAIDMLMHGKRIS